MVGNKKEAATWLKPAGEHRSAVTDTSIAASYTRSVEEMFQCVKPENQASPDETAE